MTYKINDIIYTKDGRRSGNLTVIAIHPYVCPEPLAFILAEENLDIPTIQYEAISDYGNVVRFTRINTKHFFTKPGHANEAHKYYNYYENYPEELL